MIPSCLCLCVSPPPVPPPSSYSTQLLNSASLLFTVNWFWEYSHLSPSRPPPSFLLFSFSIHSRRGGADVVVDLVDTVTFPQWNRRPMLPLLLLLLSKNSSLHHLPRVSLSLSFYFISKKKGNTKTRNGWLPIKKIDD